MSENETIIIPKILLPKVDVIFKTLFGSEKNSEYLISLLEAVLRKKIEKVELLNPAIRQMTKEDKLSILDVKTRLADGEVVDIEMQIKYLPEMRNRITYYSAGMIKEQIGSGDDYSELKPAISIIIVAESLILESKKCHNVFSMLEREEHIPFNDLQEIHILDLSRISRETNEPLSDWLKFINSEDEEDFMKVARKNKVIKAAYDDLKVISADKQQRIIYEARLKQQMDNRSAINGAMREGVQRGEQKRTLEIFAFLKSGHSLEEAEKKFSFA
jgi:predicted transposase/invertase (TIGR01784 family)